MSSPTTPRPIGSTPIPAPSTDHNAGEVGSHPATGARVMLQTGQGERSAFLSSVEQTPHGGAFSNALEQHASNSPASPAQPIVSTPPGVSKLPPPSPSPAPPRSTKDIILNRAQGKTGNLDAIWKRAAQGSRALNMATIRDFRPPLPISFTPSALAELADRIEGLPAEEQEKHIDEVLEAKARILIESMPTYGELTTLTSLPSGALADAIDHLATEIPKFIKESALADGTASLHNALIDGLRLVDAWHKEAPKKCEAFLARPPSLEGNIFDNDLYATAKRKSPNVVDYKNLKGDERSNLNKKINYAAAELVSKMEDSIPEIPHSLQKRAQHALRTNIRKIDFPKPSRSHLNIQAYMGKLQIAYAAASPTQANIPLYYHPSLDRGQMSLTSIGRNPEAERQKNIENKSKLINHIIEPTLDKMYISVQNDKYISHIEVIVDYIEQQPESYPSEVRLEAFRKAAEAVYPDMSESEVEETIQEEWSNAVASTPAPGTTILLQGRDETIFDPLDPTKN